MVITMVITFNRGYNHQLCEIIMKKCFEIKVYEALWELKLFFEKLISYNSKVITRVITFDF
jgi:hypothetical protein